MAVPDRLRRSAWLAAGLLLIAILHAWRFRHHLTDDAFISFRYLANLFAGEGLVYNAGERVWGFTNLLWMGAIAPGFALGLDPLACARGLGLLASLGLFGLVLAAGPGAREGRRAANLAGAALLATSGPFLLHAWSGLETSFFSLLVLATLCLHQLARVRGGARDVAAGGCAALATLTRPEGALLFGLLLADALLERRAAVTPLRARLVRLALGFAPLVLVTETVMAGYYGSFWPNSIDAKVGFSLEQIRRGLHYAGVFARHYPVHVLVPLAAALRWRAAGPDERLLLRAAFLFGVFPVLVGGDWMLGYRLFQPFIVLGACLAPFVLAGLEGGPIVSPRRRAAVSALVVGCALLTLAAGFRDPRVELAMRPTLVHAAVRIGQWMRENLPAGALLATNTAGTIPYYSRLPVLDMMGLNDRAIAHRRDLPARWKGIEKGDGRYVLSRRPDFVQLGSYLGARVPLFLSDIELFGSEAFHRRYELVEIEVDPVTTLRIWRRRESERGPLGAQELAEIRRIAERQLEISAFRY